MKFLLVLIILAWCFCCYYYKNSFFYLLVLFEGIYLLMFMFMSCYTSHVGGSFDSIILFLSIMVADGGFGLGLLIFITSRVGDDSSLMSIISVI